MLQLAFLAVIVVADFPGGSVGKANWVSPQHLRVHVEGQSDQDRRNRQANWYYFRLDGAKGRELTVELTDLVGEYNYQPGALSVNAHTHPVYSYDNEHWTHFEHTEWDDRAKELKFRFTPEQDTVWIAHTPPYTLRHLRQLEEAAADRPYLLRGIAGWTVQGREIPLWTITEAPDDAPVIWLMFRQHSWESGSSWIGDGGLRFLLGDTAEAARMRKQAIWKIFPVADPDGVEIGGVRFNVHGYDLNRNWDAIDPKLTPEIAAEHDAIESWLDRGGRIDMFLTVHNTETSEYLQSAAEYHDRTARFRRELTARSSFLETRPEPRDWPAPDASAKKGRMSVSQGLYAEFGIPSMLLETRVSRHPKLDDRFRTIEDWKSLGADLIRAAARTVAQGGP